MEMRLSADQKIVLRACLEVALVLGLMALALSLAGCKQPIKQLDERLPGGVVMENDSSHFCVRDVRKSNHTAQTVCLTLNRRDPELKPYPKGACYPGDGQKPGDHLGTQQYKCKVDHK